ncbi:hypothetical protein D3C80_1848490 [compost metagenome]
MVSSIKPMIDANAVPLITCTENPTVGAMAIRTACGTITRIRVWPKLSPRQRDASHCPFGRAAILPDQISTRKALVNSVSASAAAVQGLTSMPNSARPKNARNSCISSGVP